MTAKHPRKGPMVHQPQIAAGSHVPAGQPLVLPVFRDSHGNTTIRVETSAVRGAERTFAVECAFVRARHGLREMLFVQLDPYDDAIAARVAVVRYTIDRFIERAKHNEPFRLALEAQLSSAKVGGGRGEVGRYTKLAQAARPADTGSPYSALLDAEVDVMMYTAQRGALIYLGSSPGEISAIARGASQTIALTPQLEVTMSSHALADLLIMWKDLAGLDEDPS